MENDKAVRLTAPKVQNYIDSLNSYGLEPHACTPETLAMLPELFAEVMKISPYYANGVRLLHFCVDRGPIEDFGNYEDMLAEEIVTDREDFERLWKEYFPDEKCWFTVSFFENDGYRAIRMNHKLIVSHRDDSHPARPCFYLPPGSAKFKKALLLIMNGLWIYTGFSGAAEILRIQTENGVKSGQNCLIWRSECVSSTLWKIA